MSSSSTPSNASSSRFAPYRNALKALSARTGTPLPSLIVSFGILHEVTAILPIIGIFYGARSLGVGEHIVDTIAVASAKADVNQVKKNWFLSQMHEWMDEGEQWTYRVGRRYGLFGFEQRPHGEPATPLDDATRAEMKGRLAGDVANAVFAYGATKALLPARIGLSLWFAPTFSRHVLDPVRYGLVRVLRRPK
ncbi:hypothetical protein CONPUDRAFT_125142 [Coniophora puteana RWD-64-598 SS2]|uniref:Uncharacterized protein n=1 Tax=Coniophora puteana (strain RWD-64-598) TaxID=741705 RepID=A0A5M3MMP7_CONPW|nr:uncharacterized protein CONPUDRAFT_125142 [Coniophora puteana RWD-64-598 SS2]EIW80383.1 hypothetical protein CONPUDRAFT_125142 [Coniophora puteana RWD-64-598 SS2]